MPKKTNPSADRSASCSPVEHVNATSAGVEIAARILRSQGHDLAAKRCEDLIRQSDGLLAVAKLAYRKHHLDDQNVGWDELSDRLCDALCNVMGDARFQAWLQENSSAMRTNRTNEK